VLMRGLKNIGFRCVGPAQNDSLRCDHPLKTVRAEGPQFYSLGWSEQRERRPRLPYIQIV
jgi:hypothetical protein